PLYSSFRERRHFIQISGSAWWLEQLRKKSAELREGPECLRCASVPNDSPLALQFSAKAHSTKRRQCLPHSRSGIRLGEDLSAAEPFAACAKRSLNVER